MLQDFLWSYKHFVACFFLEALGKIRFALLFIYNNLNCFGYFHATYKRRKYSVLILKKKISLAFFFFFHFFEDSPRAVSRINHFNRSNHRERWNAENLRRKEYHKTQTSFESDIAIIHQRISQSLEAGSSVI